MKTLSDFKISPIISKEFNKADHEGKKELTEQYKRWYRNDITIALVEYLETEYTRLVQEDEKKSDFISKFQFSFISIRNKAQRTLLKSLIKKLNYEI